MAYIRKTKDRWDIETNYGYGWEVECSYDTCAEAKRDIGEYRIHVAHYNGQCRIVKRREKINVSE